MTRTVYVTPGSEVDRLLEAAAREAVVLVREGVRFRLIAEPDVAREPETDSEELERIRFESASTISPDDAVKTMWDRYDPDEVRTMLRELPGSMSDEEANKMIEAIYRWREEGSRPASRPYDWFKKHAGYE